MDTLTLSCFLKDGNYSYHREIKINIEELRKVIEEHFDCDDKKILESFSLSKIE